MDYDSDLGFCPGCGADVKVNETFCRSCGRRLYEEQESARAEPVGGNRARLAFIIMAVVGVFLLWMGASTLMDVDAVVNEVLAELEGFGFDEAFAEQFVLFYAYGMIITALISLVGGALAVTRKFWIGAMICAILVTLTTPLFLFSAGGVLAIYFLWRGKGEFIS